MRPVFRTFIQGLVVSAPIILTVYVCTRATLWLDSTIRAGLEALKLPDIPGLGVLVAFGGIYLVGLLARTWFFQQILHMGEWIVEKIPLVKSLYSAVRDLLKFLSGSEVERGGRPARVHLMDGDIQMIGLITQSEPESFLGNEGDERIGVYLPMSYQIGGFTVYVDREKVERLPQLSVEDLLKLSMTAGVSKSQKEFPEVQPRDESPERDES